MCQGAALLVPKEPAKVCLSRAKTWPCSCKGTRQGVASLVPRCSFTRAKEPVCAPVKEPAKERAKAQSCSCQGATVLPPRNLPRNVPRSNRARAKARAKAPLCSRQGTCQGLAKESSDEGGLVEIGWGREDGEGDTWGRRGDVPCFPVRISDGAIPVAKT
ncbi:hypothetical protein Scep_016768 [Stephania cephalantha]|uniref:Uncharacterized protein n=1 Tax=Stephania cephalantha TaxID=152367 RepID=A0AAP0NV00_9MAGN